MIVPFNKKLWVFFLVCSLVSCASEEATGLPMLEVSDTSVSDPVVVTQDSVVQANNTSQTSDQGGSSETNSNENSEEAGLYLAENSITIKANSAAKPGDTLVFEGVEYLVINDQMLRDIITDDREDISKLVTTYVTDLSNLFENKQTITPNIAAWDTSNVTDMSYLFAGASVYNGVLSYWNTAKVTNMSYAFANALEYNQDLGDWNTSQVTQMEGMFSNATVFDQDLSGWCVSLIDKAPTNFAAGSSISQTSLPQWGTCPE
jgi:hypothetical protein